MRNTTLARGRLFVFAVAVAVAITATIPGQELENQRKQVEVKIHYGLKEWIMSPTVTDDLQSRNPGVTHSVFARVRRAIDSRTGQPFDLSEPTFDCDPDDIRHMFRLEKKEFLLGEPILVEHRIELNGPGEWSWEVGGNYRMRGRDDNFAFILRRVDGITVPDVYPKDGGYFGGGISVNQTITKDKPLSYWLGLQRFVAITEPGVYDLFCVTGFKVKTLGLLEAARAGLPEEIARDHYLDDNWHLIDQTTGNVSLKYEILPNSEYDNEKSPVSELLPNIGEYHDLNPPGVVAKFRITIRQGTRSEQQLMVDHWTKIAEPNTTRDAMGGYKGALSDAMWYAKQDHFLPLVEKWIRNTKYPYSIYPEDLFLEGLAMRSDIAAFKVFRVTSPAAMVGALYRLHTGRITDVIPICIMLLSHENEQVRSMAEFYLSSWTCQSFWQMWDGSERRRPTLEEGKKMQPLWQAWWAQNRRGYVPRNPSRIQCKESEQ